MLWNTCFFKPNQYTHQPRMMLFFNGGWKSDKAECVFLKIFEVFCIFFVTFVRKNET